MEPTVLGARNSGDTRSNLGLHVDGTQHVRQPPILAFQFLDEPSYGGESVFVDGAAVLADVDADELHELVAALASPRAATFAKKEMSLTGPVLWATELETLATRLRFDDVMTVPADLVVYRNRLRQLYNDEQYRISFKPREGDLVVFDNWRYLHGRDEVFGHRVRRHHRLWLSEFFGYRQSEMRLGLRGFGAGLVATVQLANRRVA